MSQQKAFYELPLPKRQEYVVIVLPKEKASTIDCCQYIEPIYSKNKKLVRYRSCDTFDEDTEVFECNLCSKWVCDEHMSKTIWNGAYICVNCAALQLSQEDMERIEQLTNELNRP